MIVFTALYKKMRVPVGYTLCNANLLAFESNNDDYSYVSSFLLQGGGLIAKFILI